LNISFPRGNILREHSNIIQPNKNPNCFETFIFVISFGSRYRHEKGFDFPKRNECKSVIVQQIYPDLKASTANGTKELTVPKGSRSIQSKRLQSLDAHMECSN